MVFESSNPLFEWDGLNLKGNKVNSGVYYVMLKGEWGAVPVEENFSITVFE